MKVNKKLMFIPILGFFYCGFLTFINIKREEEKLLAIAILYNIIIIAIIQIIAQKY